MRTYVPKYDKNDSTIIILDNLFEAGQTVKYAKEHNMKVLMTNTTSTSSVEIIMEFQKNGFAHKLFEKDMFSPDGIKIGTKVLCLFDLSKVSEIVDKL